MGSISAALILEAVRPAFIDSTPYLQMSRAKVEFVRTRSVTHVDFCQHVCSAWKKKSGEFIYSPLCWWKGGQESEQKSVIGAHTKTVSQNSSMGYHFKDIEHIFHMIP